MRISRHLFVLAATLAGLLAAPAIAGASTAKPLPIVDLGSAFPTGIAVDETTHTAYVSMGGSTLAMINTATCNGTSAGGCAAATIVPTGGYDPIGVAVDDVTQTLYTVNGATGTVAVLNAATCNASITTGCKRNPRIIKVGGGPEFLAIDDETDTVYVVDQGATGTRSRSSTGRPAMRRFTRDVAPDPRPST